MIKLWRVESADGHGPFNENHFNEIRDASTRMIDPRNWDTPIPKFLLWNCRDCRFAFTSLDDLKRVFQPHNLAYLEPHGYRISEFEVPESNVQIRGPEGQVMFTTQLESYHGHPINEGIHAT